MEMNREREYAKETSGKHLKELGQFFTPYPIAEFMASWACKDAKHVLDPAAGNSVFLTYAKRSKCAPNCTLTGYEIDEKILSFFGNPAGAKIRQKDYLLADWEESYDAILCNPPYHRFQDVKNREEILDMIERYTGNRYSSYTNLYILFLLKSLYQLSPKGRLAYIIPTEFLNSGYGTVIKEVLLQKRLLKAVINFKHDEELFFNATTTCCILLVDHEAKEEILFYNLTSLKELELLSIYLRDTKESLPDPNGQKVRTTKSLPDTDGQESISNENSTDTDEQEDFSAGSPVYRKVTYEDITAKDKWRSYLLQEEAAGFESLVPVSSFVKISRGIATGANDFFCMTASEIRSRNISPEYLSRCICRSADVKGIFLTDADYDRLNQQDKKVNILDIKKGAVLNDTLLDYLNYGREQHIHEKHLPSHRNPWYLMEQREVAPIWVTNASRNGMKFVRNLAGIHSLTTFHSVYVHKEYEELTDLIFCYFLTPTAQKILRQNRKELGNGLEKFQPSDLSGAKMLDLTQISEEDRMQVQGIYEQLQDPLQNTDLLINRLDGIFLSYLI